MALLAEIYKLVLKAGLIPKAIRFLPLISLLTFIIGWGWLLFLPTDGQYRNTYISENALMPSQAYSYFRESEWNILRGYRRQINEMDPIAVDSNLKEIGDWLVDIGLKVEYQKTEFNTTNLYAIWHSPRSDGTEAMVLAAPYFQSDNEFNVGGLSLLVSLTKYFKRWTIWSKNLIFVIPQDPGISLRSWVNEYHNSLENVGSLESAIILDFPSASDNFEYVELYYEGLNGQLPNLDLINVCVYISEHEGPRVSLQEISKQEFSNSYWNRLKILLLGLKNLSLTGINKFKGQESFSGWKVQALTIKAIQGDGNKNYDITTFGRIIEAVFRCVNNLLEKFHQSFFFFFMLQPRNFISIGTYLPSGGLVLASYLLSIIDNFLNEFNNSIFEVVKYLNELGISLISSLIFSFVLFEMGNYLPISLSVSILIIVSIFIAISSNFIEIKSNNNELKSLLRSLSISYIFLTFSCLLTLNFSLTLILSSFNLIITLVKGNKKINNLILILTNPFLQILIISQFINDLGFFNNILFFFNNLINSWNYFGNHTWLILIIGYFPGWLLMSLSNLITVEDAQLKEKKDK